MESWQDQGIILAVRAHGENGAIVSLLTRENGRQSGYVRGATSSKMRGTLEQGNIVDANWQARTSDSLGSLSLELSHNPASRFLESAIKLSALQSACGLCDAALPEREGHAGLFHGLEALFTALETDLWGAIYVMWEIALLRELGFSLNLKQCAGGGDNNALAYVSPKTGRAVSLEMGQIYKERLLQLPEFLKPQGGDSDDEQILLGLHLTGYFLEHWVFAHHSKGIPEARLRFHERFAKTIARSASGKALESMKDYGT